MSIYCFSQKDGYQGYHIPQTQCDIKGFPVYYDYDERVASQHMSADPFYTLNFRKKNTMILMFKRKKPLNLKTKYRRYFWGSRIIPLVELCA